MADDKEGTHRRDSFIVFGSPLVGDEEIDEVVATMREGWLSTGPRVTRFENAFAAYKGARSAAAVSSDTAAMHLSMIVANLQKGDQVITTPLTFCATVNAIIHAGAEPVLADVDPATMNIDPDQIERKLTPRTKAILPVHLAGRPCDMDGIAAIAERRRLLVIEDCAHAIETEYRGRKAGTIGDFGCFSFYVTKNVMTGEGGMVLAKDPEKLERIKILALHGVDKHAWSRFNRSGFNHYLVTECGFKYNMTDIEAAIGLHQLRRVEDCWERRRSIWTRYQQAFRDLPLVLPREPDPDTRHAFHLYTVLVDPELCGLERDDFIRALQAANIGVGVHYLSIPEHPYYQESYGWRPNDFPNAMRIGRQTVSLPLSPKLSDDDVAYIINVVQEVFEKPSSRSTPARA